MDGYQSDELFDGSPLLQTSCSSSESGDSEPEADSSRDKHIEFMRIAFRAKQPQQLDSARTKTNSAKPSSTFSTPFRPHSSTRQENTTTASKRTPGSTGRTPGSTARTPGSTGRTPGSTARTPGSSGRTPGSAGRTPELVGPTKDRSHEMSGGGEHCSSPLQEHALAEVLNGLTGQLKRVVSRLDRQEKRMESIEKQLQSASSSGSSSSESRRLKEKVPLGVRAEVRRMYRVLQEEDQENFQGFDLSQGVSFKDDVNTKVVERLIKEVQATNPAFQAVHVRAAAYTYYRTLGQESSLKRRGIQDKRKVARRRRERITRKLSDRLSSLNKSTLPEKDKNKWRTVFTKEFMSSEESASDADGEDTRLLKRPIPWRSDRVTTFFYDLDKHKETVKSSQSKRQTKARTLTDEVSSRPLPDKKMPSWAVVCDP